MSIPDHDPTLPFTGRGCAISLSVAITLWVLAITGLALFFSYLFIKLFGG